jgi:hypothetical protein
MSKPINHKKVLEFSLTVMSTGNLA